MELPYAVIYRPGKRRSPMIMALTKAVVNNFDPDRIDLGLLCR
jgi:hypothetical protein